MWRGDIMMSADTDEVFQLQGFNFNVHQNLLNKLKEKCKSSLLYQQFIISVRYKITSFCVCCMKCVQLLAVSFLWLVFGAEIVSLKHRFESSAWFLFFATFSQFFRSGAVRAEPASVCSLIVTVHVGVVENNNSDSCSELIFLFSLDEKPPVGAAVSTDISSVVSRTDVHVTEDVCSGFLLSRLSLCDVSHICHLDFKKNHLFTFSLKFMILRFSDLCLNWAFNIGLSVMMVILYDCSTKRPVKEND